MASRFDKPANRAKTLERFGKALASKMSMDDTWKGLLHGGCALSEVLDYFITFDPTDHKEYVLWMLAQYVRHDEDGIQRFEDLYRVHDDLAIYYRLKVSGHFARNKTHAKDYGDILRLTYSGLVTFVEQFKAKPIQSKAEEVRAFEAKLIESKQAEIVLDTETTKIVIPHTAGASAHFGKNTRWCTTNGSYHAYARKGPLFIILEKKRNRRWQFHFETAQFMDELDRPIHHLRDIPDDARKYFGDDLNIYFNPELVKDFRSLKPNQLAFVFRKKPEVIGKISLVHIGENSMRIVIERLFFSYEGYYPANANALWNAAQPDMRAFILKELLKSKDFFKLAPAAAKTIETLAVFLERMEKLRYSNRLMEVLPDDFFRYVPRNILTNASVKRILDIQAATFKSLPNEFKKDKLIAEVIAKYPAWVKHVPEPSYDIQRLIINEHPVYITALSVIDRGLKAQAVEEAVKANPHIDLLRYPTLAPNAKDAKDALWKKPRPPKVVRPIWTDA